MWGAIKGRNRLLRALWRQPPETDSSQFWSIVLLFSNQIDSCCCCCGCCCCCWWIMDQRWLFSSVVNWLENSNRRAIDTSQLGADGRATAPVAAVQSTLREVVPWETTINIDIIWPWQIGRMVARRTQLRRRQLKFNERIVSLIYWFDIGIRVAVDFQERALPVSRRIRCIERIFSGDFSQLISVISTAELIGLAAWWRVNITASFHPSHPISN